MSLEGYDVNVLQQARTAYASSAAPIRTESGTEYDAFARVTHRLKTLNPKTEFGAFVRALHENRQLWTLLAIDVADSANQLPQALRAQIFYLAEFTAKHTSDILSNGASHDPLVDINTAIMRGLRQQGRAA